MAIYVRIIDGDGEEYLTTRKELSAEIVSMQDEGFDAEIAIVKQADKIEELCDYCIYRNCEDELIIRKLPLSSSWKSIMRSIESGLIHDDIKLAIVTDKGLIYAAKMNEEGDFELL